MAEVTYLYLVVGTVIAVAAAGFLIRRLHSDHKLSRSSVHVLSRKLSVERLEGMFVEAGGRSAVTIFDESRGVQLIQPKHLEWELGLRCSQPQLTGDGQLIEAVVFSERVYPKPAVSQQGFFYDLLRYVLPDKVIHHADEIAWTKRRFLKSVEQADPNAEVSLSAEYLQFL